MDNNLIFIGPFPPPFGGIAVLNKGLIDAGLNNKFKLRIINTAITGKYEEINKIRFKGILHGIACYIRLLGMLLNKDKSKNIYLTGTCNAGLIRDFGFIFIAQILKKHILFNFHGTRNYSNQNVIIRYLTRISLKWSAFVLSPTKKDWEKAKNISSKKNSHIKLYYNSCHIQEYLLKDKTIDKIVNKFKIVGIGRLSDAKGSFDLINAFVSLAMEHKDIELTWIGRGASPEDEIKAKSIIDDFPEIAYRVHFLKDLSEKEKFDELCSSDLFVLPTKNDNLPIAILEALAVGLPVISTYIGAIPEVIIQDSNGWLINSGDTKNLKEKILFAMYNPKLLKDISSNNKNLYNSVFASYSRVVDIVNCCQI